MSRELSKEEIQASYDSEQANIGKFSSLLSASCKYAWAGSLAIFFSSIVAANAETLGRFQSVFYFLWAAAFLGATAFVFEIYNMFLHIGMRGNSLLGSLGKDECSLISWMFRPILKRHGSIIFCSI
jgi:hypothetical protein